MQLVGFAIFFIQLLTAVCGAVRKFPKLPLVFSATVEANIINKNRTVVLEEAYDFFQAQSYRTVRSSHLPGQTRTTVTFYNTQQTWWWLHDVINDTISQCNVIPHMLTPFPATQHAFPSINEFMLIGNTSTESFNGTGTARGIPCDIWSKSDQTHHSWTRLVGSQLVTFNQTANFELYWYFAMEPWAYSTVHTRVPVRAIIRGTHVATSSNTTLAPDSTYNFEHYYEFVKFYEPPSIDFTRIQSPVSTDWTYKCDTTQYCTNTSYSNSSFCSEARGPTLPPLDDVFLVEIELLLSSFNRSFLFTEAYDNHKQLAYAKYDTGNTGTFENFEKVYAKEYWSWHSEGYCILSPNELNFTGNKGSFSLENGYLASPRHWFGLYGTPIWQGYTTVRGIPAERWYVYNHTETWGKSSGLHGTWNASFTLYFSSGDWTNAYGAKRVPLGRDDALAWIALNPDGSMNSTGSQTRTNNVLVYKPNQTDVEKLAKAALGNWRLRNCNVTRYCNVYPNEDECVPPILPSIPNKYSTTIAANFYELNYSLNIFEVFDGPRHRYASRKNSRHGLDLIFAEIDADQVWSWQFSAINPAPHLPTNCRVDVIEKSPQSFLLDSRGKMISARDYLRFGAEFNETYLGPTVVRNISVDGWYRRIVNKTLGSTKYDIDMYFYFSSPSWSFSLNDATSVPVRVYMKGIEKTSTGQTFEHVYDFINFRSGNETDAMILNDITPRLNSWSHLCNISAYCSAAPVQSNPLCTMPHSGPTRPVLPRSFELGYEGLDLTRNVVIRGQIYFDAAGREHNIQYGRGGEVHMLSEASFPVHDGAFPKTTWTWREMYQQVPDAPQIHDCRVQPLSQRAGMFDPDAQHVFKFNLPGQQIFFIGNSTHRGMPTVGWRTIVNDVISGGGYRTEFNYTLELFFTQTPAGGIPTTHQYPIFMKQRGKITSRYRGKITEYPNDYDFHSFNVIEGVPHDHHFQPPLNWDAVCNTTLYCARYKQADPGHCQPHKPPPIKPELAFTSYSTMIEAKVLEDGLVLVVDEAYHALDNALSSTVFPHYDAGESPDSSSIERKMLISNGEMWMWDDNGTCDVTLVGATHMTAQAFGPFFKYGLVPSIHGWFSWTASSAADVLVGEEYVRGILCSRYDRRISNVSLNITGSSEAFTYDLLVKQYFSHTAGYLNSNESVPVRVEVDGAKYNSAGKRFPVQNVYDFINFRTKVPHMRRFQRPSATECTFLECQGVHKQPVSYCDVIPPDFKLTTTCYCKDDCSCANSTVTQLVGGCPSCVSFGLVFLAVGVCVTLCIGAVAVKLCLGQTRKYHQVDSDNDL